MQKKIRELTTKDFRDIGNELIGLSDKLDQLEIIKRVSDPSAQLTALDKAIANNRNRMENLEGIKETTRKSIDILAQQLKSDSTLLAIGGLAEREYQITESNFIESRAQLLESNERIQEIYGQILDDERTKISLETKYRSDLQILKREIDDQLVLIRRKFQEYKDQYVILAPISGMVTLENEISDDEMIQMGDPIMMLTRDKKDETIESEMYVGVKNAGKIKPGMIVRIGLDEFDQREYGIYYSSVRTISQVENGGMYKVNLECILPITTSYNINLPVLKTYNGQGEILLGKITLFTKIKREIQFNKAKYASL